MEGKSKWGRTKAKKKNKGRGNERGRGRGMDLREKGRCRRVVKDLGEKEKEGGRIKRTT
jgi:hypothetical protein